MPLEKKQIYILDDDESILRSYKLLMDSYGFAVEVFSSAEKFFSAVPTSSTGCLIMDIHMPGVNEEDVQQKFLESGYSCSVIIITGDKSDHVKEKAIKQGAVAVFHKPFDVEELIQTINHVLDKAEKANKE